jgi:hypothetical protein
MSVKHYQIITISILAVLLVFTGWPTKDEVMAFMQSTGNDDIYSFITGEMPKPKEGALSWEVFNKVKEIKVDEVDKKTGFENEYFKPEYTEEVKALDGQTVRIMGFMFPLTATKGQTNFLMGPFALSCPYHFHISPKLVIEVASTEKPINFTYDQIIIEGKFEVKFNQENQVFYFLNNAKLIKKNP